MYTAFIKEIDGIRIVFGLDSEKLDPVKTSIKIKPIVENCNEYKAKQGRLSRISALNIANDSLMKQGKKIINRVAIAKNVMPADLKNEDFTSGETNSLNGYNTKIKMNNDEIKAITEELKVCEENLKNKIIEIQKTNGVYFDVTNEYENRITDSVYADYSKKLEQINGKKMFLCEDGSIIIDNRNKTFYGVVDNKWIKKEIKLLSEKVDSSFKLYEDLSIEEKEEINIQFEKERLLNLTIEEKEAEKNSLISQAVTKAGIMRNELEIVGDPEALTKAQEYYNTEKLRIEKLYT